MRSRFRRIIRQAYSLIDLTPHNYVIVRQVHPLIRAGGGYYAVHPTKVWHWVKNVDNATQFRTEHQAIMCAQGSDISRFADYKIERV